MDQVISDGLIPLSHTLICDGLSAGHRSVITDDSESPVTGKDPSEVRVSFDGLQIKICHR